MDSLNTLQRATMALVVFLSMVTSVTSTRCYMCRDVIQRRGNRNMFIERYANYADMGWISPCTDQTFVVYPQVECVKKTYITYDMCNPKKCMVKVIERYPMLPPAQTAGKAFFDKPFETHTFRDEKECKNDLCNGEYKNQYNEGLKCYYQCGRISLLGLTNEELAGYDLPVIPCDDTTINYCRADMECGYIVGSANYRDETLGRQITVQGWFAHCFYKDSDSIDHVLEYVEVMMQEHPTLQISPKDLTKCDTELCNTIE